MPLATGTWTLNSNGSLGELVIQSVDTTGNLTGSLVIGSGKATTVSGFWDEISQKIAFEAGLGGYTGCLFQDQFRMPGLTGSVVFTLAGSFVVAGVGNTPAQLAFGWYAQIGVT
jgi:hypothetical protein